MCTEPNAGGAVAYCRAEPNCVQNAAASLVYFTVHRGWEMAVKENGHCGFGLTYRKKKFLLRKTNKDIKWTSSVGTLKEYFTHSILITVYSLAEKVVNHWAYS